MYIIDRSKEGQDKLKQNEAVVNGRSVEYLTFPILENTRLVKHLFTTRLGGYSEGMFSSMNLSFQRGDDSGLVQKNYGQIAHILNCEVRDMVASMQTHTTNIRVVTKEDAGKGITKERDYRDIDGLITDSKDVVLVTFFADCVPLYFVDTRNKVIGLAHSGWRGTVSGMGACMVEKLRSNFGSRPEDIVAAIGPSICRDCYEVSQDVASEFIEKFGTETSEKIVFPGKSEGKYQIDLWMANKIILMNSGIKPENIAVTDICTCHNPDYLFSHRASNGKRGNLAAFLGLL